MKTVLSLAVAAILLSAMHAANADTPQPLEKIKVTADEEQARSTVGNSTVVASNQLEAEQAQNFEDAIRYVPGISIVDLGRFGDNGFNIRGLEGDRVALTIDNLPLAESVETTPAYEFFRSGRGSVDIDALKSIEVVKGADSITAGSGALGGAVMLTTKDPRDYLSSAGNDSYFRVKAGYTSSTDEIMVDCDGGKSHRSSRIDAALHETSGSRSRIVVRLNAGRRRFRTAHSGSYRSQQ